VKTNHPESADPNLQIQIYGVPVTSIPASVVQPNAFAGNAPVAVIPDQTPKLASVVPISPIGSGAVGVGISNGLLTNVEVAASGIVAVTAGIGVGKSDGRGHNDTSTPESSASNDEKRGVTSVREFL